MATIKNIEQYQVVFPLKKGTYYDLYRVIDAQKNKFFLRLFNLAKLDSLQIIPSNNQIYEIELIRNISHVNIIHQVDDGETIVDGQRYAYSVCNFVPGELLSDSLARKGGCSIFEMKQIVSGVLNGLKYLHSQPEPIIFNSISPNSIMLDLSAESPQPLLIDFGHARKLNKENKQCYMNGLSPFYLAPEMFKGLYSSRTDLYAVGALMYHLVFGIEPWEIDLDKIPDQDREKAILTARKKPLPIPDIKVFEMDNSLLSIMAKALSQDVDLRFQSADEFLSALTGELPINCTNYKKIEVAQELEKASDKPTFKKRGNGFDDVAGMDELKKRLQEEVIDLLRNPEKYKRLRVKTPNGILLYGPPGCGKTFIAEKFAEELGCNYMYIHCSDVASPYIHGGQEKIAAVFQQAYENAPTILFLDELDAMLASRSLHDNISMSGEVNEFLTQLNNCGEKGVIVIGATNNPTMIDPAALRSGRFDIKEYVPAPSESERELLFKLSLRDIAAKDVDYKKLASLTDGYVSKDICALVNRAALVSGQQDDEFIKMQTLLDTIEKSKGELPSVSSADLRKHEEIRDKFKTGKKTRPIGFTVTKD